jgi:hypothetical protein
LNKFILKALKPQEQSVIFFWNSSEIKMLNNFINIILYSIIHNLDIATTNIYCNYEMKNEIAYYYRIYLLYNALQTFGLEAFHTCESNSSAAETAIGASIDIEVIVFTILLIKSQ